MLQNAYLDAKISVDPAENEPRKECWCRGNGVLQRRGAVEVVERRDGGLVLNALETQHSFGGSFSAGSTPIFASKYAFCSIFSKWKNYVAVR